MVLHVSSAGNGELKATVDSLDQGVYGIEASSVVRNKSVLRLEVRSVNAEFEGTISPTLQAISGNWSQNGAKLPLTFRRQGRAADTKSPMDAVATSEGVWQSALETKGLRFRLQLHMGHDTDGHLVAALDSIDQGIKGVPATEVTQKDAAIHFELPAVGVRYDGTLNPAKDLISGTWQAGDDKQILTFKRSDQILELRRPQTPVKPYPYKEEEITFRNAQAGVSLSGTLTVPRGTGPFPAAILLAGSGPLDRDEADSAHRPFLVLADHLTRQGVAVLRYDKRGIGKSSGNYDEATTADFASDAEAALSFLSVRKDIDGKRIGLIGHSEGGVIAPMIASHSDRVAWIVLLAGPATPGEQTLLLQSALIAHTSGMSDVQVAKSLDFDRQAYKLVREEKDRGVLETKLSDLIKSSGVSPDMPQGVLHRQIHWTSSPWFRYFLQYDPSQSLERTKCPVLALIGEKDLQVPPDDNVPLLKKALTAAGNQDFQVVELPDLNHLFQHCLTGLPTESRAIEETFAPEGLKAISDWIAKHTAS